VAQIAPLVAFGLGLRILAAGPAHVPHYSYCGRLFVAHLDPATGAQLFLSPRTVEWHLSKVFGKLGISSRKELGSAVSDIGANVVSA
jgi:DNA-binding transcriptional ArsR family regulator